MSPPELLFLLLLAQLLQAETLGQADAQRIAEAAPDTAKWQLAGCRGSLEDQEREGCNCHSKAHICQPRNILVGAKKQVTLPCSFAYSFSLRDADDIRVYWRSERFHGPFVFNTTENYSHPNISGRVSLVGDPKEGNASIQIDDLKEEDSNLYFCRISVLWAEKRQRESWQSISGTNLTVLPAADELPTDAPSPENLLAILLGMSGLLAALVILGLVVFLARRKGCGPQCPGTRGAAGRGKAEEAEAGREAESREGQDLGATPALQPPPRPPRGYGEPGVLYASLAFPGAGAREKPPGAPRKADEETTYAAVRH